MKVNDYIKQEKLISDLQYKFVKDFVKFRKDKHFTQQELANEMGVIREKIARIENDLHSPTVKSLITMLAPLGYTIAITKIKNKG